MDLELWNLAHSLPEMVMTAGSLVLLLLGAFSRGRHVMSVATLVVLGITALSLRNVPGGVTFSGMFVVDGFSTFFKWVFLVSATLTVLVSRRYLEARDEHHGEYYALLVSSTLGMMIMASASDLISLYVGLELMALSTYVLAGFLRSQTRSNESSLKYFLMGAFSSGLLLYATSLIYGFTGETSLVAVAEVIADRDLNENPLVLVSLLMFVAAFGFKIAAAPFHMWAPDVYEGAPTPVTAFMSVGPKAAGFAVLARVFTVALEPLQAEWTQLLIVVAVLTMAIGNVIALSQTNIKRMLAYSSIAHAGYALIGVIAGTDQGLSSVMNYMMIYAFMNIGAFSILILLDREGADTEQLDDLKGLSKTRPLLAFLMLVFMFSLTGIPPTAGFIGKFYVFVAALDAGHTGLVIWAVLFSAISAYYYLRVVKIMYMDAPGDETGTASALSVSTRLAAAVALAGVLVIGVYPDVLLGFAEKATRLF